MAFASNNPFRAAVLPHALYKDSFDPAPLPMSPSHSAPPVALRAPSFNSKNPFLDVLDDSIPGNSSRESVLLRRSTSDSSHENIRPLPDLFVNLSVREEDDMHTMRPPPPPPPPRSSRRQNLDGDFHLSDKAKAQRNSESSTFDSHAIIEAYMPLDRDNRPRESPLPTRHRAHNALQSRHHPERRRRPSDTKEEDPFATPPSVAYSSKHSHRHALSTPQVQDSGPSLTSDRSSRRDDDEISHHKSRSHTGKSTTIAPKLHHHHHAKSSSPTSKSSSSSKKQNGALDKIDKLDVTGIFGTGFHHDGPFDACNPHRNVNKKKAPMLAFPVDSENNAVGAPRHLMTNTKANGAPRHTGDGVNGSDALRFDPVLKADPVHGIISLGLGSSTFLEGAPASRAAIMQQRMREKDSEASVIDFSRLGGGATLEPAGAGLTRKKSIVQKIIGINNTKERDYAQSHLQPINVAAANAFSPSRSVSADGRKESTGEVILEEDSPTDIGSGGKTLAVTTTSSGMLHQASSPGTTVSFTSHTLSPTSPSAKDENGAKLLKRVKSLKVGGRKRAE
ncbi:Pal1 cell morphology protein-domain-containing protein [Lipomyces chichibuensis]|uniref:Pal1 cell morphology protein-domain-containing protein n=1 Tax=Lipomyces chichibuensis TaxID=1546026 RepID=UPI0033434C05